MPIPPSTCWMWMGTRKDGYGRFYIGKKRIRAHRMSYELHKGFIPKVLVVRHSCDNRWCVNPEHLTLGTVAQNNYDKRNMKQCSVCGTIK